MMIKPAWEVKGEKRTSEIKIVEKLMDFKLQKTEKNLEFFFSRAIEISRQFYASWNSFFYRKI